MTYSLQSSKQSWRNLMRRRCLCLCLLLAPLLADEQALLAVLYGEDATDCREAIQALTEQGGPFSASIERALWSLSREDERGFGVGGAACALLSRRPQRQVPIQERLLFALGEGSLQVERLEAREDGSWWGLGLSRTLPGETRLPPLPVQFVLKPGPDLSSELVECYDELGSLLEDICARAPALEECLLGCLGEALALPLGDLEELLLYTLESLGPRARPALPALIDRLESGDQYFPLEAAVDAWIAIGVDAERAVPVCVAQLESAWVEPEPFLRLLAALGPAGAAAAPSVLRWLPEFGLAWQALIAMGPAAAPSVASLVPEGDQVAPYPSMLGELIASSRCPQGIAWVQMEAAADPDGRAVETLAYLGPGAGLAPEHFERWLHDCSLDDLEELLPGLLEAGWPRAWLVDLVRQEIEAERATPELLELAAGLGPEAGVLLPVLLANQEELYRGDLLSGTLELAGALADAGEPALALIAGLLDLDPDRYLQLTDSPSGADAWWELQEERIARLGHPQPELRDRAFSELLEAGPRVLGSVQRALAEGSDPQTMFLLEKLARTLLDRFDHPEIRARAVEAWACIRADDPGLQEDLWGLIYADPSPQVVISACESLRGLGAHRNIGELLDRFSHIPPGASTALGRLLIDLDGETLLQSLRDDPRGHAHFLVEHGERLASRVGRGLVMPLLAELLDEAQTSRLADETQRGRTVGLAAARLLAILGGFDGLDPDAPDEIDLERVTRWWERQGSNTRYLPAAWLEIEQSGLEPGYLYTFSLWNAQGRLELRQRPLPGSRVVLGPYPPGPVRCIVNGQCFDVELSEGACRTLTLPNVEDIDFGDFYFD